ncbi:MAG: hypothetical protein AAF485_21250, partial [Chloroflexota bacterium]
EGRLHRAVLPMGFATGFILVSASKLIQFYNLFGDQLFLNEVVVDLVFELGVAVWGGVMTTFLLGIIERREKKALERYKAEVLRRIAESEA